MIQTATPEHEEDDLSGIAGWMYADLLIGLMVIFLATITFVPAVGGLIGNTTTGKPYFYTYSRILENKPLSILVQDRKLPNLTQMISDFKAANNIQSDAKIAYVQIIGSYKENLETKEVAISRALELSQQIDQLYHDLFKTTSTTFNTTTTIPSNEAVIRILFAETVSVGKE